MGQAIRNTLSNTHLLADVEPTILDMFFSSATSKSVKKGQVLFMHEDEATHFYVIKQGWVKLFRETYDGDEVVVDVLNDGHIFGETSIFEQDIYSYGAQAVEDVELISIPLSVLKNKIQKSPEFAMRMFGAMSRFRKQQDFELEHRDVQNAPQRIGCFLLRLCKPDAYEAVTLHLPYDKTLIASRLGMKPETFSRGLSKLRNETGIRIKGATVEIDTIEQLTNYSCSACSSTYPCQDMH